MHLWIFLPKDQTCRLTYMSRDMSDIHFVESMNHTVDSSVHPPWEVKNQLSLDEQNELVLPFYPNMFQSPKYRSVFLIPYVYIYVWWNSHVLGTVGGWKWWNPNEIFHSRSFFFGLDNHEAVSVFVVFLLRTRFLDDQLVLLKGQFGQSTNVVVVVWKWGTPKNDKKCLPSGYD